MSLGVSKVHAGSRRSVALLALSAILGLSLLVDAVPTFKREQELDTDASFGFDYLHLVQEWPGSFCDTKWGCKWPVVQPTTGWLLHGLWPEFKNGSWPQYCDPSAPFNISIINDLLPELGTYWPSLVSPDQAAFWSHEWTRHGTCCETLTPSEHEYFRLVLNLREQFDAYNVLATGGIMPGNVTTWSKVKGVLEAAARFQVEVGCNTDAKGHVQLFEVRSCYAPVTAGIVTQIDCQFAAASGTCGGPDTPIYLPPFH